MDISKISPSEETIASPGEVSYGAEGEDVTYDVEEEEIQSKKQIGIGDSLPFGPRLHYETPNNVVRIKDIAENNRILILGVLGSFTPDCWNRHLFRVLNKLRYYDERDVDYICCISTNDAYTQRAWAVYLGCDESVLMWADPTTRFTKALGMDVVIPWLDDRIRSRRYVIFAEDMTVSKMIVSPIEIKDIEWHCEHLNIEEDDEEDSDDSWI